MATTKKLRRRLYEIVGVTHAGCGGQICAEWFPGEWDVEYDMCRAKPYFIPPSWECHCVKCSACDPNGWPTLKDCVREAPGYWMAAQ